MIDPDVGAWVLDFLLRQPLDDSLLRRLVLCLPFPSPAPSSPLHQTLILRRLSSDLSRRSLTHRTLHSLELLSSLPRPSSSAAAAAALRVAYAAVAADLTVKPLRPSSRGGDDGAGGGGGGGGGEGEFYDAVNRIWNCRVADLEAAAEGAKGAEAAAAAAAAAAGLVSPELKATRREMEEAVVDATVRAGLVARYVEERALEDVRVYLEEAWKELGPSFLEIAAEALGMAKGKGLEMENPNSSKPSPAEGSRLLELVNHSGTVNKRGKEIIEENNHQFSRVNLPI